MQAGSKATDFDFDAAGFTASGVRHRWRLPVLWLFAVAVGVAVWSLSLVDVSGPTPLRLDPDSGRLAAVVARPEALGATWNSEPIVTVTLSHTPCALISVTKAFNESSISVNSSSRPSLASLCKSKPFNLT